MLILVAALTWALIGGATALWLAFIGYECTTRRALIIGAACGPVVWLFVASVAAADFYDRNKRRL